MKQMPNSLVDILMHRAGNQSQQLAYRFLRDGEDDEVSFTYETMDRQARSVGAALQQYIQPGDRVLLLLPAGPEFITGYFGCLYAQAIAIPLPAPHPARLEHTIASTLRIVEDARPAAALLPASLLEAIQSNPEIRRHFQSIHLLVIDTAIAEYPAHEWKQPSIKADEIAFLQYTSGSTSTPRGVMVSHANLLHNLEVIQKSFAQTGQSEGVIWLPPYHDMGLIGGILESIFAGSALTLLPHWLFLQRPLRWLSAVSRFRATISGGPNFAYDLCVKKIKPEQREQLDLSNWAVAFNGAEPINPLTLDQFAAYFAPCGFRREAFTPCYGLAEATLMVSGGPTLRAPVTLQVAKSGLEEHSLIPASADNQHSITLAGCGQNLGQQQIRVISPDTLEPCPQGQIGEIWVSGPSVAKGYWNNPAETEATMNARIAGTGEGPFLRTGDLGFMHGQELFITGRLKNMIIIDGKNHYPHDIERTVTLSHIAIPPGGCAVFTIPDQGNERLIVLAEIQPKLVDDNAGVVKAIRRAIAENHDLQVHDIKLVLPGGIPRTTSGKIQHLLCRKNYLNSTIKETPLP